jgi:hypothetical protein
MERSKLLSTGVVLLLVGVVAVAALDESLRSRLLDCVRDDDQQSAERVRQLNFVNGTCLTVVKIVDEDAFVDFYVESMLEVSFRINITTELCSDLLPLMSSSGCRVPETHAPARDTLVTRPMSYDDDVDLDDDNCNSTMFDGLVSNASMPIEDSPWIWSNETAPAEPNGNVTEATADSSETSTSYASAIMETEHYLEYTTEQESDSDSVEHGSNAKTTSVQPVIVTSRPVILTSVHPVKPAKGKPKGK